MEGAESGGAATHAAKAGDKARPSGRVVKSYRSQKLPVPQLCAKTQQKDVTVTGTAVAAVQQLHRLTHHMTGLGCAVPTPTPNTFFSAESQREGERERNVPIEGLFGIQGHPWGS